MERPPLPRHLQLDFQREEDEPITLLEEPRAQRPAWRRLFDRMFPRPGAEPDRQTRAQGSPELELSPEDGRVAAEAGEAENDAPIRSRGDAAEDPESLEPHMIRLRSGREFHDAVTADREENLYAEYERLSAQRRANALIATAVASAVLIALAMTSGIDYFSEMVRSRHVFELSDRLGSSLARGLGFIAGFAAPITAFALLQSALTCLLEGIRERRIRPLILFIVLAGGCVIGMTRAGNGSYLSGLGILIVAALAGGAIRGMKSRGGRT